MRAKLLEQLPCILGASMLVTGGCSKVLETPEPEERSGITAQVELGDNGLPVGLTGLGFVIKDAGTEDVAFTQIIPVENGGVVDLNAALPAGQYDVEVTPCQGDLSGDVCNLLTDCFPAVVNNVIVSSGASTNVGFEDGLIIQCLGGVAGDGTIVVSPIFNLPPVSGAIASEPVDGECSQVEVCVSATDPNVGQTLGFDWTEGLGEGLTVAPEAPTVDGDVWTGCAVITSLNEGPFSGGTLNIYDMISIDGALTRIDDLIEASGNDSVAAVTLPELEFTCGGAADALSIVSAPTNVTSGTDYSMELNYSLVTPPGEIRVELKDDADVVVVSACAPVATASGTENIDLPIPEDFGSANTDALSVNVALFSGDNSCADTSTTGGLKEASQSVQKVDPQDALAITTASNVVIPNTNYDMELSYSLITAPGEIRAALQDDAGVVVVSGCVAAPDASGTATLSLAIPEDFGTANVDALSVDLGLFSGDNGCADNTITGSLVSASQDVTRQTQEAAEMLLADFEDGFGVLNGSVLDFGVGLSGQAIVDDGDDKAWQLQSKDPWGAEGFVIGSKFAFASGQDFTPYNQISFMARTAVDQSAQNVTVSLEIEVGNGSVWKQRVGTPLTGEDQTFTIPLNKTRFYLDPDDLTAVCGSFDLADVRAISVVLSRGGVTGASDAQITLLMDDVMVKFDPTQPQEGLPVPDALVDDFSDADQYNPPAHANDLGLFTDDDNTMRVGATGPQNDTISDGALTLVYDNASDYWYTQLGPRDVGGDISKYSAVRFMMRGTAEGQTVNVEFRNAQQSPENFNRRYASPQSPFSLSSTTFQEVLVPLNFACVQHRAIESVTLTGFSPSEGTVEIDSVELVE